MFHRYPCHIAGGMELLASLCVWLVVDQGRASSTEADRVGGRKQSSRLGGRTVKDAESREGQAGTTGL